MILVLTTDKIIHAILTSSIIGLATVFGVQTDRKNTVVSERDMLADGTTKVILSLSKQLEYCNNKESDETPSD